MLGNRALPAKAGGMTGTLTGWSAGEEKKQVSIESVLSASNHSCQWRNALILTN
jgi:hypothetical protein